MRKFKKIDAWISLTLLPICIFISLYNMDETFFFGYFIIGGWQIISILVHQWKKWFVEKGSQRRHYHNAVIIILVLVLVPLLNLFILIALLFVAPIMACYYAWLCYNEVYVKMQRPLAQLK